MQSILQYHLLCRSVQDQYGRTNEKSAGFVSPFPKQILVSANKDEFGRRNTSDNLNSEYEKAPRYFDPELRHDEPIQVSLANGTQTAIGTSLGFPLEGVKVRERTSEEGESGLVFVVGWDTPDNPMNPHNWSMVCRIVTTIMVCLILTVVSATSSIDAAVKPQSSQAYHVVAGNLTTGCYLIGFGTGALVAGSFSETFGRNVVYIISMFIFIIFIMATGLAPNYGAAIVFRFLTGLFGAIPLTCAGGTIADLWSPLEATLALPFLQMVAYAGPMIGPVIRSYVGMGTVSWRWSSWIMAIFAVLVLSLVLLLQPETYGPLLLKWKAHHLRQTTGDPRYRSETEIIKTTLWERLRVNLYRPFLLVCTEPIIVIFSIHLTIIYIVVFSLMNGYTYIFPTYMVHLKV
ncbi:hypothetical protein MMC12_008672 [Toensbergia leucococca]|nr:hypothetical protein [Toensbergia leucococca]